jgi:hypothetical protein
MGESPKAPETPMDLLQRRLGQYVGPHTARLSLKAFANKHFGVAPADLPPTALPELIRSLRPLLRSLLGEVDSDRLMRLLLAEQQS